MSNIDLRYVGLYRRNDAGRLVIDYAYLPAELCTPKCLVVAAIMAGAYFVTCPAKYGGRMFLNPEYESGHEE